MEFKRVAIYVRVSTESQIEGYSIGEQIDILTKFCEIKKWKIYDKYIDGGYSGSNIDRPALNKLIEDCNTSKFDLVLVYKLDRLSRSQKDTMYLIEEKFLPNNVDFISITENFDTSTPFGRAMIGILSVFAQLERENIKSRMRVGKIGRAKSGKWIGHSYPPIGYDYKNGELVVNDYEAMQVREAYNLYLDGYSMTAISNKFNKKYVNKYSNYKSAVGMRRILENPIYIGKLLSNGELYEGNHQPIIDEQIYYNVQEKLKKLNWSKSKHYSKHLLSGYLVCEHCGSVYNGKTNNNGKDLYYICKTRNFNYKYDDEHKCYNHTYRCDILDKKILDEIVNLKYKNNELYAVSNNNYDNELTILNDKIVEIENKISKTMDLYTIDGVDFNIVKSKIELLTNNKKLLQEQLNNINNKIKNIKSENDKIKETINSITEDIYNLSIMQKRKIIETLIDKIIVKNNLNEFEIKWKI